MHFVPCFASNNTAAMLTNTEKPTTNVLMLIRDAGSALKT